MYAYAHIHLWKGHPTLVSLAQEKQSQAGRVGHTMKILVEQRQVGTRLRGGGVDV